MKIVGERIRALREGLDLSQSKISEFVGTTQSSINRYEKDVIDPPFTTLLWYADYFDVSLDYIFGRTDEPRGKLYDYQPDVLKARMEDKEELKQFIEMCFDPNSPMYGKLKETLFQMLDGDKK